MTAVRCKTCLWTGSRKSEPADAKPCPNGHPVSIGPWPPSSVETTPSGICIEFWDEINVESGLPQQRRYKVDGEKLPSVTAILGVLDKPALLDWAARLAREGKDWREVRDDAGDRGTSTHQVALDVVTGKRRLLSSLEPAHRPYGQAAMAWVLSRNPKVVEAERMVASPSHGFSGRTDLLWECEGDLVLSDYKSVTRWYHRDREDASSPKLPPYPENALQLDLYSGALVECGYPAPDYGMVIRFGPDGEFDETPFELDLDRGLAILGAYRAKAAAAKALTAGRVEPAEIQAIAA